MSVPVIRVVAERIDDIVSEALDALVDSHPGIVEGDGVLYPCDWSSGEHKRCGITRGELKRALKESALWVDVRGVPIEPPPVIVCAVGDCLEELGVIQ